MLVKRILHPNAWNRGLLRIIVPQPNDAAVSSEECGVTDLEVHAGELYQRCLVDRATQTVFVDEIPQEFVFVRHGDKKNQL